MGNTNSLGTIFVVIDPTTEKQRALNRAIQIAKISGAKIHTFLCIYSGIETDDPQALQQAETSRYNLWIDKIVEPARAEGVEVTTQIEWNKDWFATIAPAAKAANSDLILKPSRSHSASERMFMISSDLAVFKTAQCPVFLIKSEEVEQTHKVLIAIDAKREDEKYSAIRDKIIGYGKATAASFGDGELHAVHTYTKQDNYVHVTDMAKLTGLDSQNVHIAGDSPERAIAKTAEKIHAQVVIIGLSTKSTLKNRVFGSTGEWLLNNLNRDLLVVFPEGE